MTSESETRERLLLAGAHEIELYGLQNLSMRRVAAACGVSCAAPYKHYKNRSDFIIAIIRYIKEQWRLVQEDLKKRLGDDIPAREMLTELCIAYIKFLVEHPNFRSVLMTRSTDMTPEQIREKTAVSTYTSEQIRKYCSEVNMSKADEKRKTFLVRSLLYGAAIMIESGELENSAESYEMVRRTIEREFELS